MLMVQVQLRLVHILVREQGLHLLLGSIRVLLQSVVVIKLRLRMLMVIMRLLLVRVQIQMQLRLRLLVRIR
ncbi:hypothetical protein HMPREF2954_08470 [Neisseria sp. HMSC067H09]|nr:hypothetical protein HMPREF2638_10810 [Neisseria sp. HMSC055F11]OFR10516.1 hypothetical protein HMPREF2907_02055 [Neisseria sp. HMSC055H02]OFS00737.1 hypothetical protein HMPREF2954_08470 [Neisseria sp. HMSC067H09]